MESTTKLDLALTVLRMREISHWWRFFLKTLGYFVCCQTTLTEARNDFWRLRCFFATQNLLNLSGFFLTFMYIIIHTGT